MYIYAYIYIYIYIYIIAPGRGSQQWRPTPVGRGSQVRRLKRERRVRARTPDTSSARTFDRGNQHDSAFYPHTQILKRANNIVISSTSSPSDS